MSVKFDIVLSLFNGMGTGRQAFHDLGIEINKYYSSEIKPYAIELQQHHFPDVIQVGDILNWKSWDIEWHNVDFILSGSLCEAHSRINKNPEGIFHRYKTSGFLSIVYELKNNNLKLRTYTKTEMCRLQGFEDNYCEIISTSKAASLLGDGWTLPVIKHIFSFIGKP